VWVPNKIETPTMPRKSTIGEKKYSAS